MFGFDMKYRSSVLPEMCLSLQFDKNIWKFFRLTCDSFI